jgi:hypothetical protein
MQFFPYKKSINVSVERCKNARALLENNIEFNKAATNSDKLFVGKFDGFGYLIKNRIHNQNSFNPYCIIDINTGKVSNYSEVTIKYRMNYWVSSFMSFFMISFLVVGVDAFIRFGDKLGLILVAIFIVSYGIMMWGFNKELKRSETWLKKLLTFK